MTMTDVYDDDLDDLDYGDFDDDEEPDRLAPLETGSMSVSASRGGGAGGSGTGYSDIIAQRTKVSFDALYDWVRDNRPDEKIARNILSGLLDLARLEWQSPTCLRQLRFDQQEAKAKYWLERLADDKKDQKALADNLLSLWGQANLVQIEIRTRRLIYGLKAVEEDRPRWYTAIRKKELVERFAAWLDNMAFEYFRCRLEQHRIMLEEAEDRARHNPSKDYSQLIKRITTEGAKAADIAANSPWSYVQALELAMMNPGEKNPHMHHVERMNNGGMLNRRRRARARGAADEPAVARAA